MPYIYSTLTADQIYTNYQSNPNGLPTPTSQILVRGGANLMTKALVTPLGVVTPVSDEELAELKCNEVFKLHLANGFLTISNAKSDVEKVVCDMTGRDNSAPIVEQDEIIPLPAGVEQAEPTKPRRRRG